MKIELGNIVKCKITGFEGMATARVEYINGCIQFCVKPPVGKENRMPEGEYIDEGQLTFIDFGFNGPTKTTGGPQADCPK